MAEPENVRGEYEPLVTSQRKNHLQTWEIWGSRRKGRDSNPGDRSRGLTVFKTAAFNRSATLPGQQSCYALVPRFYTGLHAQGEVAEWLKALAC